MSYTHLFEVQPLIELAAEAMNSFVQKYKPTCWKWDEHNVGDWVEDCLNLPYRKCFESNFINGKKLINIEARHLPHMNITNWEHIQYITKNIRYLFNLTLKSYPALLSQNKPNLLEQYWKKRAQRELPYEKFKFTDFLEKEKFMTMRTLYCNRKGITLYTKPQGKVIRVGRLCLNK